MAIVNASGIGIGITISGIIVGSVGGLGGGSARCGGVGWCVGFISYVIFSLFLFPFFLSTLPPPLILISAVSFVFFSHFSLSRFYNCFCFCVFVVVALCLVISRISYH